VADLALIGSMRGVGCDPRRSLGYWRFDKTPAAPFLNPANAAMLFPLTTNMCGYHAATRLLHD